MDNSLISDADYEDLPPEPERRFLALASICKSNLLRLINEDTGPGFDAALRLEFMGTVAAAAEELGIEGLWYPTVDGSIPDMLDSFNLALSQITTKLRLRNTGKTDPHSVQLANRTRARIKLEVQRLRDIIEASDLDDARKKKLFAKLDELTDEMDKSRVSFARVMTVLACVGLGVASGTSFLADAPNAIATITSLIGADKEAETREQERLGAPPVRKALPPPARKPLPDFGLPEEIPF